MRAICSAALLCAANATIAQPNMIFILVDDLRHDGMGFVNDALVTPNIDRLAQEGMYLPHAVVATSLCSPSRATILTGQSTRNHGIVDNNDTSEAGLRYFPQSLQAAGYETAFIGKWHMGRANDAPRPGFDHWVSFKGQGFYNPTDRIPAQMVEQGVRHQLNVNGRSVDQRGYLTDELNRYALEWLERRDGERPFFLYLSHKAVHSNAQPAPRHAGQYADVTIGMPDPDLTTRGAGKPMWVHNQRNSWHGVDFAYHGTQSIDDYVKQYYATLSAVDDGVGMLLAWLDAQELERNTLLVFYSDNGFLFGDHGLIDKRNAYEPSVRVPMVVYGPDLVPRNTVVRSRVRNLDLAPTFVDFAQATPDARFEGISLKPLLTGEVADDEWDSPPFTYEYYWEWTFPHTPTTFAITDDEIKYVQYHGVWDLEELYDLNADPHELNNVVYDERYRNDLIRLRAALYESLVNDQGAHVVPYTEKLSAGLRFRRIDGAKTAEFPPPFLRRPGDADLFHGFARDQAIEEQSTGPASTQE